MLLPDTGLEALLCYRCRALGPLSLQHCFSTSSVPGTLLGTGTGVHTPFPFRKTHLTSFFPHTPRSTHRKSCWLCLQNILICPYRIISTGTTLVLPLAGTLAVTLHRSPCSVLTHLHLIFITEAKRVFKTYGRIESAEIVGRAGKLGRKGARLLSGAAAFQAEGEGAASAKGLVRLAGARRHRKGACARGNQVSWEERLKSER